MVALRQQYVILLLYEEKNRKDGICLPQIKRNEIAPGAVLTAIDDRRFKSGLVSIDMYLPLDEEHAAARALVPYLVVRSCKEYPDYTSLRRRLAELYGASLKAGTGMNGDRHKFTVGVMFLDDRYALEKEPVAAQCASLLASMVFDPPFEDGAFRQEDIEIERRLMLERIDAQRNDKIRYARLRCIKHMCAGEPYGLEPLGTREQVENVTAQEITQAWQDIVRRARIEIVTSGSFDTKPLEREIKKRLEAIGRNPAELGKNIVLDGAEEIKCITERAEVKQAKLVMGWRTPICSIQGDYMAAKVGSAMLGGISNSMLFTNVREKMSLCYYCSAAYVRSKGILLVQSGLEEDNAQKARDAIENELEKLKRGEVPEGLLEQAKKAVVGVCRESNDSVYALAEWYGSQALEAEIMTPEEHIERTNAVTMERVITAAKSFSECMVYILAGEEENR